MPHRLVRGQCFQTAPHRRIAGVLALTALLAGCDYKPVPVGVQPQELTVFRGESASVVVTAAFERECSEDAEEVDACDLGGHPFDYVVQNLPTEVIYRIDGSLQSPSTPDVVRIVFEASANAPPGLHELVVHAYHPIRQAVSLGHGSLSLRVVAPGSTPAPTAITATGTGSFALLEDGTVRAWGHSWFGQIGDGTTVDRPAPVAVLGLSDVRDVAAGFSSFAVLRESGALWSWGYLSDRLTEAFGGRTPLPVPGVADVRAVDAGLSHALWSVGDEGELWAWGYNTDGQLGDGTLQDHFDTPVRVPGLTDVRAVAVGAAHSLAVVGEERELWAWGWNDEGTLGDGTQTDRLEPVSVGLADVRLIAAGGSHSLAVVGDAGEVWAWGDNASGQLGNGERGQGSQTEPVRVTGLTDVRAIAAGTFHSLAVTGDSGQVWAWGRNDLGQLGEEPDGELRVLPAPVPGLSGVRAIAAAGSQSMALTDCGQVWTWGTNHFGQLGDSTLGGQRSLPLPVPGLGDDSACPRVALRVSLVGGGRGTVAVGSVAPSPAPDGDGVLSCFEVECAGVFDRGTTVTLSAAAAGDATFTGWGFECEGSGAETTITLDRSKRCVARFTGSELLLLTAQGDGGRITSSVAGIYGPQRIDCGDICDAIFAFGTEVALAATADAGFEFDRWSRDCAGTALETTVVMDQRRICRAEFRPFTVGVSVVGEGRITSDPPGLDCGSGDAGTCAYGPGASTATVRATPALGWQFDGWADGGDCSGAEPEQTLAMDTDRACTAIFSRIPGTFLLDVAVEGQGSVTSSPAGIDCPGATCRAAFAGPSVVTLTAQETEQSEVLAWQGDCEGVAEPPGQVLLEVSMTEDRTCRIIFQARAPHPVAQLDIPGWPFAFAVGEVVTFDGRASYILDPATGVRNPPGATITSYTWDFGDGTPPVTGSPGSGGGLVQHAFQAPGEYQVRLVVEGGVQFDLTDEETRFVTIESPTAQYDLGIDVSSSGTATVGEEAIFGVHVEEQPSDANPGVVVEAPLPAGFTFVRTHPSPPDFRGTYDPATGLWTFTMPEVGFISSMQIVARADVAGTHTFSAAIVAGLGAGDFPDNNSADIDFTVFPSAGVTACLSSVTQVSSGPFVWEVEADASCSSGPIVEYRWWRDFNFAGQLPTAVTATPVSPRLDYEEIGTYDIRLEVRDAEGNSHAVQVPFTVQ